MRIAPRSPHDAVMASPAIRITMGSGVAPQCSRNRCLARWTVRIPHRGRGGAAGRATRRKAWSRPRSEGLCPSRSRLRCRIPITASCIFGGADAGSSRRELAHETDRLDNLRGDLPALTGVLGVVGRISKRCAGCGRLGGVPSGLPRAGWRVLLPWPAAPEVHNANQAEHEGAEHVPRGDGHRSLRGTNTAIRLQTAVP
jgi:hypothetical protein